MAAEGIAEQARLLFAAHGAAEALDAALPGAIARLQAFYGADGEIAVARTSAGRVAIGVQRTHAPSPGAAAALPASGVATFGNPPAADLADPQALGRASPDRLLRLPPPFAAVAWDPRGAVLVSAAFGPATLYSAAARGITAWSSHAVAAALLVAPAAAVDEGALPELLAAEFVGGERTLVAGVRAVAGGTRIGLGEGEPARTSFSSLAARWAPVPAAEAQRLGETALVESLGERAGAAARPGLGLTGGLDSRVTAVALQNAGVAFQAFTWGRPDWPDTAPARVVAGRLGLEHEFVGLDLLPDKEALRAARGAVRWTEGTALLSIGTVRWPAGIDAFVTGAGGEIGRAFYYRLAARNYRRPRAAQLARLLARALLARLEAPGEDARRAVEGSVTAWVEEASAAGIEGWRVLDAVYAEQRVRRWGRAMMPERTLALVPAFAVGEVARAMSSLPLEDRTTDAFHRRFLARHAPAVAEPAQTAGQRRLVPPIARRAAAALRARRPPPARPGTLGGELAARPLFRDWIAEEVLAWAPYEAALGRAWAERTRAELLAGTARGEATALLAAGPVALAQALAALPR